MRGRQFPVLHDLSRDSASAHRHRRLGHTTAPGRGDAFPVSPFFRCPFHKKGKVAGATSPSATSGLLAARAPADRLRRYPSL